MVSFILLQVHDFHKDKCLRFVDGKNLPQWLSSDQLTWYFVALQVGLYYPAVEYRDDNKLFKGIMECEKGFERCSIGH